MGRAKMEAERKKREEEEAQRRAEKAAREREREIERLRQEKASQEEAKKQREKSNFVESYTPSKQHQPPPFSDGYQMTPQGQDKWDAHPSTMENYNIDDLSSGDETDDDERPRKAIPAWAQKSALKSALRRQYKTMRYPMLMDVFLSVRPDRAVELKRIFDHLASDHAHVRYRAPRRSSGQWTTMVEPAELVDRTLNLDQSCF